MQQAPQLSQADAKSALDDAIAAFQVEENKQNLADQTDPSGRNSLRFHGPSSPREQPTNISSYTINEDTQVGPKLATIQERQGSFRSSLKFHRHNEDNIDEDLDVEKLRKRLLRERLLRCT